MNDEIKLREQICILAKSMFDRGLTGGSTGNISSRTSDGGLLVSPTGTSFGRLDPGRLSRFDADGEFMLSSFYWQLLCIRLAFSWRTDTVFP